MEAHLADCHPEYAHPGKVDGLPLLEDVYEATVLTVLKESKFGIPTHAPFTKIQQKVNVWSTGVHALKHQSETQYSFSNLICSNNTYKEGSSQQLKACLSYIHYFAYCLLVVYVVFLCIPCIGTALYTLFTSKSVVLLVTR
ncbi:hypothetical protein SCLCIDRAFT_1155388 [Scleroderma citrinum Foug A]|uniref:Uncharacterized protein n=1 Tax=Scleroderma citrinum Foug A TaxID=1036808 RepID=A0A0C3EDY2_9AGAM|nr:hypothetical protein SCLCIDRAFT_1155388 [Scleroderma citrinum Foug A]